MSATFSECGWNVSCSKASSMSDNKMHKRKTKQRMESSVGRTDRKVSINAAVKIGKKHVRDQNS